MNKVESNISKESLPEDFEDGQIFFNTNNGYFYIMAWVSGVYHLINLSDGGCYFASPKLSYVFRGNREEFRPLVKGEKVTILANEL